MRKVASDIHFPTLEKSILEFWKKEKITEKGLSANAGKEPFVFYDGPPFATGLPHYGHILPGTLKDIVPRYWVMKGKYVQRRWGWDCHGLPVEFEMEKELGLGGRPEVEKYGIAKFNESCRAIVMRYTQEWQQVIERSGRWVDFKNNYRTMDTPFMETLWWVIRQLWDKGLIVEGFRVMPYSWRISTPLSNFEAGLNYKEVQDPAITVAFKSDRHDRYLLAWTTTPWTLPSNLALSVHPDLDYVEIEEKASGRKYVLAASRLTAYYKSEDEYNLLQTMKGRALENETYAPLFPYFADRKAKGAFKVLCGEHVAATDGTGIVHTAPAFGEEDFEICKRYQIDLVDPVDADGRFTSLVPEFQGQLVKDADKGIIADLKKKGLIVRHETLNHNYPFCWRSDTPLIYKAISTWFLKIDPIKKRLIENNAQTHWVPEHLRDGRFGNWLENARDWNISRNRFWGTPIPVWRCAPACGGNVCVSSIDELEKLSGKRPKDIHKHFVDDITIPCPKCQTPMKRVSEVLDCWFESGSMPYGQLHYPFENKEAFEKTFPADFIAEGIDQTRGWFYTLSVLSTALFDKPPFKNVIVNGLVLAEDGKKMSKRLKNYPDPVHVMENYGADALRAYLMNSPASHAEDLRFSEAGVKEVVRSVVLPLWNAYSFFVTYALADDWDPKTFNAPALSALTDDLDRWVVSRLHHLIEEVDEKMAIYHLSELVPHILRFIDELTNWYIRLNRRRFWEEGKSESKEKAYQTLYYVLTTFSKVLAPILPFVTEEIFQNLERSAGGAESVHLSAFPTVEKKWIDARLETQMDLVQSVVSMGRNLRNTHKIKTRQPLKEFLVITKNPSDRETIERYTPLISQELNVKKVSFSTDEAAWVDLAAKANAKVLGPKLGPKMKVVLAKIKELSPDKVAELERNGKLVVEGETISVEDVSIERKPKREGLIQTTGLTTVWLDSTLTPELVAEGRARELVNRIQKLRKDLNFEVTDRIRIVLDGPKELSEAVEAHRSYVSDETLARELSFAGNPKTWTAEQEFDEFRIRLFIERANE